jgi:hypothetical protein
MPAFAHVKATLVGYERILGVLGYRTVLDDDDGDVLQLADAAVVCCARARTNTTYFISMTTRNSLTFIKIWLWLVWNAHYGRISTITFRTAHI